MDDRLEVVVVGAGIGGLTAAVALRRAGHSVRIVDQVRELRPVGAGISLWPNGVAVLHGLGLGEALTAVGGRMERMAYVDHTGTVLCDFSFDPLVARVGVPPHPVRRSDLQALLLAAVGPERVRLGVRCAAVEADDAGATVVLDTGERLAADLVVAADGTRSRLRAHVVGHEVGPTYLGYHNWNGLVPDAAALGAPTTWTTVVGDGCRVSTMPVREGQYAFFDVPRPTDELTREPPVDALRAAFAGWPPAVARLVDALDPAGVVNVAIRTHDPLPVLARGRVVLLGDAAHTAAPDLGQGGCMAMEDAVVLTHHLAAAGTVEEALRRYSDERVPRAADVIRRAAQRARITHGHDPDRTAEWYASLGGTDGAEIIDGIAQTVEAGPGS